MKQRFSKRTRLVSALLMLAKMLSFEDVLKEFEDFFANGILFRSSPLPLGICSAF